MFSLEELLSNCFFPLFRSNLTAKFDKKQPRFQEINWNLDSPESSWTFPGISSNTPRNLPEYSPESSGTFPRIFNNIHRNLLEHFSESLITFHEISWNHPWILLEHSPESFRAFSGMLKSEHSPEFSKKFSGILVNIPRVPSISRIPFPIPVFLV